MHSRSLNRPDEFFITPNLIHLSAFSVSNVNLPKRTVSWHSFHTCHHLDVYLDKVFGRLGGLNEQQVSSSTVTALFLCSTLPTWCLFSLFNCKPVCTG